jgi:hypothetical protein
MIIKASQRGNGSDLATHLCNEFDNEQIEIAQVRGTVATDLHGAFAEVEAIAAGTKATQPLFSLSLNPSEPMSRAQYFEAIERIEDKMGLGGQPRAVVFHHKEGEDGQVREHAHVVWSRIDAAQMRAISLSFYKAKLCDLACELAHDFGHRLPPGLKAWEEKRKLEKDRLEPTLAEAAQQKKSGLSADDRRAMITALYEQADSARAFRAALEESGFLLARGDRRGYVIIDEQGDVHALARNVKGAKTRDIERKLGDLALGSLPSVSDAKAEMQARLRAREERQNEQADMAARAKEERAERMQELRARLEALHARRRDALGAQEGAMLARHADERLLLAAAQFEQRETFSYRLRSAVSELIDRTPGLRSVLGPLQDKTGFDPRAVQEREQRALADRHERERAEIARRERALEKIEARELASLERRLKRLQALGESEGASADTDHRHADHQARSPTQTDPALLHDDGVSHIFFDAVHDGGHGHDHHDGHRDGYGEDAEGITWESRAENYKNGHRKGRGMGIRRDDDGGGGGDDPF